MTGALVKWHLNDGTPITFQDVRPQAEAPDAEPEPLITPSPHEVAGHEARHAAAALLLGLPIIEARADWPDPFGVKAHVVGYVRYAEARADWNTPEMQRKSAVVTLVGDMSTDRDPQAAGYTETWPPAWPPTDKLGVDSDEAGLAAYTKAARLDEAGWDSLCDEDHRLAAMPEFKSLATVIAALLEHGTVLDVRMLNHVFEIVLMERFKTIRRQLDQMNLEIKQMSREFDRELEECERIRQEIRDLISRCMTTDQDTTTATTTPPHVVVEVRPGR